LQRQAVAKDWKSVCRRDVLKTTINRLATSRNRAYVYLQLPRSLETVTVGYYEQESRPGVELGIFVYSPQYLERRDPVALEPFELPLRPGRAETVKLRGIFGCLRDASPDGWGRRIIVRPLSAIPPGCDCDHRSNPGHCRHALA
jgi:hypothetical protein